MGLVRFVIFALFFYLIYFLVKYIFVKPFKQGYANGGTNGKKGNSPFGRNEEGKVTISFNPYKKKKDDDHGVGEYIDYEEIKD